MSCAETVPCMEQLPVIMEWFVFALKYMFGFALGQNVYSGQKCFKRSEGEQEKAKDMGVPQ